MASLKETIAQRGRFARIRLAAGDVRERVQRLEQHNGPLSPAESALGDMVEKLAKCVEDLAILTEAE